MNAFIELFIIIALVIVLLAKPKILCNCGKNIFGKLIFAVLIFVLASCNLVYGILGVLLYIVLNSDGKEEVIMVTPHLHNTKTVKHDCIRGQPNHLIKNNKKKKRSNLKKKCDSEYDFDKKPSRGLELLINEEIMRPNDSKQVLANSNVITKGGEVISLNN